jgi:hypothetical protein
MTDVLGNLHLFLEIEVHCTTDELFLTQQQYAADLLQRSSMAVSFFSDSVDTSAKLSSTDGDLLSDVTEYQSLDGVF